MLSKKLLDILACTKCKGPLTYSKDELLCQKCRLKYSVRKDIPDMLLENAKKF